MDCADFQESPSATSVALLKFFSANAPRYTISLFLLLVLRADPFSIDKIHVTFKHPQRRANNCKLKSIASVLYIICPIALHAIADGELFLLLRSLLCFPAADC